MAKTWEFPLYPFELPSRKIMVNVTRSCPNFTIPTPGVSDVVSELRAQGKMRVLDFGAGRLRNTLYILSRKAGFSVWAVEFEECFRKSGQDRLVEAQKHKGFFLKKWPHDFLEHDFEVDAVLLVNVMNVVPDERDRKRIIKECTKRLRPGGWFLWMSQYGEPNYKPGATKRLRAPDGGWFYSLHRDYQTYFKELTTADIKAYFDSSQYREVRKITAPHHRAFVFERL